jgi:hypothetical protein
MRKTKASSSVGAASIREHWLEVQRQAENTIEFARMAKFGYVVDIIVGQLRFVRTLRGLTPSPASFNDAEFNEDLFEERMEANPHSVFAICWYWIRKLRARFYAGDYASALAAAAKAKPILLPGIFRVAGKRLVSCRGKIGLRAASDIVARTILRTFRSSSRS